MRINRLWEKVGFGRVDYLWWANHPPLAALDSTTRWLRNMSVAGDACGRHPAAEHLEGRTHSRKLAGLPAGTPPTEAQGDADWYLL